MADSFTEKPLFNKYEVGKLLGCGAFAKVYHGREIATGKSVAIKVIQKSRLNNNAHLMDGVTREISIMRRLRHPYAVKLYEVLATKTKVYFIMEFVKGGELFEKVAKGRFSEGVSRKYFQQLISAVSHFHSQGIYHRDLKPENLLLDENEDLKVSDFGLSALTDQIRDDGLLHTLCGTPAYVAPEILAKKGYDGAKIDIWSCGVILFVLDAGYLPFHDSNLMNMYRKIQKGEYRCPKWISPALKRLISRLLEVDPSTRITIEEIKQDPWFRKGYKEIKLHENEEQSSTGFKIDEMKLSHLNAFDIISFSSGLDISGILNDSRRILERMAVEESPEILLENVVKAVEGSVKTTRKLKDCAVELEGQESNFVLGVEVYRLTDRLVLVEAKWKSGDADMFANLWKDKIRPLITNPPMSLVTPLPSSVAVN